eukprot:g6049.t1
MASAASAGEAAGPGTTTPSSTSTTIGDMSAALDKLIGRVVGSSSSATDLSITAAAGSTDVLVFFACAEQVPQLDWGRRSARIICKLYDDAVEKNDNDAADGDGGNTQKAAYREGDGPALLAALGELKPKALHLICHGDHERAWLQSFDDDGTRASPIEFAALAEAIFRHGSALTAIYLDMCKSKGLVDELARLGNSNGGRRNKWYLQGWSTRVHDRGAALVAQLQHLYLGNGQAAAQAKEEAKPHQVEHVALEMARTYLSVINARHQQQQDSGPPLEQLRRGLLGADFGSIHGDDSGGASDGKGGDSDVKETAPAAAVSSSVRRGQIVTQAVSGVGGVGKTDTVVEFLHKHRDAFETGVFWILAETTATLTDSFRALAVVDMGLDYLTEEKDPAAIRSAVFKVLRQRSGWILVYDNADNPEVVVNWLPPDDAQGCFVMTSRASEESFRQAGIPPIRCFEVDTLDEKSSTLLLWRHRVAQNAPNKKEDDADDGGEGKSRDAAGAAATLPIATEFNPEALWSDVVALPPAERAALDFLASSEGLGGLPLALEQVGAYVGAQRISFEEYVERYRAVDSAVFEEEDNTMLSIMKEFGLVKFKTELDELG